MPSAKTMTGPGGAGSPVSRSNGEGATATRRSPVDSSPNAMPDDPPPAYTDEDADHVPFASNTVPDSSADELLAFATIIEGRQVSMYRNHSTYEVTLHPEYSENPDLLCKTIERQAMMPPCETPRSNVVDFDFFVDTAGIILPDIATALNNNADLERDGFRKLDIGQDNDDRRAYRGARLKSRTSRRCRRRRGDQEATLLQNTTLNDWCFRFCSDRAKVKYDISKDWDKKTIEAGITALIRSLNYQGDVDISFELQHSHITFYSPPYQRDSWPVLVLLERRYEPVNALWHTKNESKYATGMTETDMVNFMAPAILDAASGCRKNQEVITIDHINRMRHHAIWEARWHITNGVGMAGLVDESTAGAAGVNPGQILRARAVVPP
ncbi:hypothetical protein KEM54_001139, partial [Ascosphaera aggregata]